MLVKTSHDMLSRILNRKSLGTSQLAKRDSQHAAATRDLSLCFIHVFFVLYDYNSDHIFALDLLFLFLS